MKDVEQIRRDLEGCVGMRVILKANRGRKKTTVREGVLQSAYPNLFVVRISNKHKNYRNVTFTYSDVLTETVEISVFEGTEVNKLQIS